MSLELCCLMLQAPPPLPQSITPLRKLPLHVLAAHLTARLAPASLLLALEASTAQSDAIAAMLALALPGVEVCDAVGWSQPL